MSRSFGSEAQTASPCGVCGGLMAGRPVVRLGQSHLRACPGCGAWSYFPRPSAAGQASLHDRDDYFDHPYFALRRAANAAQARRCAAVFDRLARGVDLASLRGERLLDIGCDTGGFLGAARERYGVIPVGIDVSRRAVAAARERGIEAHHSTLEQAAENLAGFRVITAIDLIEHVPDPGAFLAEVRKRLAPGGVMYLETPNIGSTVYGAGRWLSAAGGPAALLGRLFPAEHVHYFTVQALAGLAKRAGLETVGISTRGLPWGDIATSNAVRLAMAPFQALDRIAGRGILICAVLRRAGPA